MNLREMIEDVYAEFPDDIHRDLRESSVINWINQAQRDLAARLKILQKEVAATVPASQKIPLPEDLIHMDHVLVDDTQIRIVDDAEWVGIRDSGGLPYGGAGARVYADFLEVIPRPAEGDAYILRYTYTPANLDEDTDESPLPEHMHHRMVDFARAQGYLRLGDQQQSVNFMELYETGLPEKPRGKERIMPGPLNLRYAPGPFDLDPGARHRGG